MVHYGYDSHQTDYKPERELALRAGIEQVVAEFKERHGLGKWPYVDDRGVIPVGGKIRFAAGVFVRHMTQLTPAQDEELTKACDDVYRRVMDIPKPPHVGHVWTETDDDVHRITSRICHECGKVEVVPYEDESEATPRAT